MFRSKTQLRVRYSETDRMDYVYYGNYAQYFEVARVEALRSLGVTYKAMEKNGVMLPVLEFWIKYYKPASYDELLTIETTIPQLPGARIYFEYTMHNENGTLLNHAQTTLVFINTKTLKPCAAPDELLELLRPFYPEN